MGKRSGSYKLWWDFRYIWMFISSAWVFSMLWGLFATWQNNSMWSGNTQEFVHRPRWAQVTATVLVVAFIVEYISTLHSMYFGRSNWMTVTSSRERWVTRFLLLTIPIFLTGLPYESEFQTWPFTFVFMVIAWTLTATPDSAFSSVVISTAISAVLLWYSYGEGVMLDIAIMCFAFGFFTCGYVINRGVITELRREQSRVRDQAVTEERFRLARDLHDTVGHSMTQITLKSELARRLIPADPVRAERELADVENLARTLSAQVRESIAGNVTLSLEQEISRARELLESVGIDVTTTGDPTSLPEETSEIFAWCLREGVMNVVKHSGADTCTITIDQHEQQFTLVIKDNGDNLVTDSSSGRGLHGMEQRVHAADGSMSFRPVDGGHRLEIRIPA